MKKLVGLVIVIGLFVALMGCGAAAPGSGEVSGNYPDKNKVVYHVSELEKVPFTLGNIRNHLKGVEDPAQMDIILVVHGPAGKAFHNDKIEDGVWKVADDLISQGVHLEMCGNTMNAQSVEMDDIMEGFSRRDEGGVVRIAELQSLGYTYIRP